MPYQQGVKLARRLEQAIGPDKVRFTLFDDYAHADRRFETMHNCSIVLDQLEEVLGEGEPFPHPRGKALTVLASGL